MNIEHRTSNPPKGSGGNVEWKKMKEKMKEEMNIEHPTSNPPKGSGGNDEWKKMKEEMNIEREKR